MPEAADTSSTPDLRARPTLRGVSHHVAALVFPVLGVIQIAFARTAGARLADGVYVGGVTGMYATSASYHRGDWDPATRRRLRRLDHSMILVGIAATYTPVAAIGIGGTTGRVVLVVVWGLALVGAVVRNLWLDAPSWLVAVVYLGVGWMAAAVMPALWTHLRVVSFLLVLAGGATYSLGALTFSRRRPDPVPQVFGYHEVFHALVLAAGLIFYVVVWRVVLRA